jgi:cytidylate kinase
MEAEMSVNIGGVEYTPGDYRKKASRPEELVDACIREWEARRQEARPLKKETYPTICFSRKIGVGAKEIADLMAPEIGYRVVDREILEYIARKAELNEKTVALFDERYRGKVNEFLALAFGEKAFIKSDYTRHLFSAAVSMAGLAPTIFVGRGIHLLLDRDQVLAVRFICSDEYRGRRLAGILDVDEEEVVQEISKVDKEQREFFRNVYGKKDASPYEFDIVINCDHIQEPGQAANIVIKVFQEKFPAVGLG